MASVLETFFILFESDASDVRKGAEDAKRPVDQLEKSLKETDRQTSNVGKRFVDFTSAAAKGTEDAKRPVDQLEKSLKETDRQTSNVGKRFVDFTSAAVKGTDDTNRSVDQLEKSLKQTDRQTGKVGKSFVNLTSSAIAAFASIFSVYTLLSSSSQLIGQTDQLNKFSLALGVNVGDIDAWGEAVIRAGGTAQGFQGSIKSINEKMVDASLKGMNEIVPFFNQLGISIVDTNGKARDTLSILPELADAFQHLSRQESLGIGQKLGLTESTILLLQSGRQAVEDLVDRQRRLGVTTKEQAEIMAKFLDQWQDFKQQGEATSRSIIVSILPAISSLFKSIENITFFLQDHENLVTGFFIAVGTAITAFALPAIKSLAVWVLTVASPFLLLAAGVGLIIGAFALLFDEIKTFQEGGDTLFGRMLESFPKLAEANKLISEGLTKTWGILKGIFNTFMDLVGLGENDSLFKNLIDFVTGNDEGEPDRKLKRLTPSEQIESDLEGLSPGDIENDFKKNDFDPKIHLDGNDGKLQQELRTGRMLIAQAATSPISTMTSSSISNATSNRSNKTNVSIGDIIIKTTASPENIPTTVADEIKKKIAGAVEFFDDGVAV